jgi:hypothetical protein
LGNVPLPDDEGERLQAIRARGNADKARNLEDSKRDSDNAHPTS